MMKLIKLVTTLALALTGAAKAQALTVGDPVPDLALPSTGGGELSLASLKGSWVVLYFYPKSFTPGCTKQACDLRDSHTSLTELGAVIVGASTDDLKTQNEFKAKHNLPFDLLADDKKELSKAFGTLNMLGMSKRSTFIISPEGLVTDVIESVSVGSHEADVANLLRTRMAGPSAEQP
jgi:peroxiredoxin Q/BCP